MGTKTMLSLIGICLLGSGCSVVSTGTRVVCARVKESLSEHAEQSRNKAWARAAWQAVRAANPGVVFSGDYETGFEAGFTEHLYRGTIQPPPLPPASYRGASHQTPQGYQSILAWFAGFRHGVADAQARGDRDIVTGPSSSRQSVPESGLVATPGVETPVQEVAPQGGRFIRPQCYWPLPW
jgi:hypothetical protein